MYHRLLLFMRPLRLPPLLSLFPYTTLFRSYLLRPRMLGSCALLFVGLVPDLLIAQPVTARVQPAATNVTLGSSATLCLEVQGVGNFLYQWQKNGLALTNQTNQCLVLTNIGIGDGGSYRATVFNAAGALESQEGLLTVDLSLLFGADEFASGTAISVASNSVKGVSSGATRETGEPLHFNLGTSNSVWYVWTAPTNGIVTFDTRG